MDVSNEPSETTANLTQVVLWDCGTLVCYKKRTDVPQSHLYAYTCKLKWDCGTLGYFVCFITYHNTTVPLDFTCISIQVGLWYCGTLRKMLANLVLWYVTKNAPLYYAHPNILKYSTMQISMTAMYLKLFNC